ncbi:MAG: hypothetical protein U9P90_00220 [Patescibacteria group bacterium]|nr:hypothetical protein [Patescibacteria group bacterium]
MLNKKTSKKSNTSATVLEHLFGSRTRVQLLYTFLNQPERSFYIRELARHIGTQINAVRRELDGLSKDDFIIQQEGERLKKKNSSTDKKYYIINQNFILFPELKALFNKSHLFLGSGLISALGRTRKVSLILLTGSFVDNKKADTDLLIIGSINKKKLQDAVRRFERSLGFEVNYTLMSRDEYKYRKEIGDQFLHRILENKHITALNNL